MVYLALGEIKLVVPEGWQFVCIIAHKILKGQFEEKSEHLGFIFIKTFVLLPAGQVCFSVAIVYILADWRKPAPSEMSLVKALSNCKCFFNVWHSM